MEHIAGSRSDYYGDDTLCDMMEEVIKELDDAEAKIANLELQLAGRKTFARKSTCEGKRQLKTLEDAVGAIQHLKKTEHSKGLRAYHCKFCDHFHLGGADGR